MTGVVVPATSHDFYNAVGLARRASWSEAQDGQRVHQIDVSLDPSYEYAVQTSKSFWEWHKLHGARYESTIQAMQAWRQHRCKVRLVYESRPEWQKPRATAGYIVLDGELLGLFSVVRGRGEWLLDHAVADGAVRLCCHAVPHLLRLYESRGFKEVHWRADRIKGRPDVVWMERNES